MGFMAADPLAAARSWLAAVPLAVAGRAVFALLASALIARRGLRRGSLAPAGALAAAVLGAVIIFASLALGLALLAFYFSGSLLTRRGEHQKAALDADARAGGGRRGALQVICTAGVAAALALAYSAASDGRDTGLCLLLPPPARLAPAAAAGGAGAGAGAGALHAKNALRTFAVLGAAGALACVCGDTWASELGVLAPGGPPRLITTGRPVPRGTSGAVSLFGTAASVAGGALVGLVLALDGGALHWPRAAVCADAAGRPAAAAAALPLQWLFLALLGAGAGLMGSLVDSYLGATVQRTWFDAVSGRVTARLPAGARESEAPFAQKMVRLAEEARAQRAIVEEARRRKREAEERETGGGEAAVRRRAAAAEPAAEAPAAAAAAAGGGAAAAEAEWIVVAGRPWLSNEGVNLLASAVTAALAMGAGSAAMPVWAGFARGVLGAR